MTRWFAAGHYARATVCAVNGTNAKRSAAAPGLTPAPRAEAQSKGPLSAQYQQQQTSFTCRPIRGRLSLPRESTPA